MRDGTIIDSGMASPGQSTEQARQPQDVDAIPTLAWSARPDGSAEFLNRRWLDYTGLSAEEASDWGWTAAVHTEDRDRLMDFWRHLMPSATLCVTENPKDVGCLQGCRRKSRVSWMHSSGWSSHGRWPASFITSQRAWGIIDAISFPRIADPSLS